MWGDHLDSNKTTDNIVIFGKGNVKNCLTVTFFWHNQKFASNFISQFVTVKE